LHEAELEYLRREEWATKAEDVLWRRSKLGLRFDAGAQERLARRMGG
jgi:glycerol-3-phosphate dehydrogenase